MITVTHMDETVEIPRAVLNGPVAMNAVSAILGTLMAIIASWQAGFLFMLATIVAGTITYIVDTRKEVRAAEARYRAEHVANHPTKER